MLEPVDVEQPVYQQRAISALDDAGVRLLAENGQIADERLEHIGSRHQPLHAAVFIYCQCKVTSGLLEGFKQAVRRRRLRDKGWRDQAAVEVKGKTRVYARASRSLALTMPTIFSG